MACNQWMGGRERDTVKERESVCVLKRDKEGKIVIEVDREREKS